LTERTRPLDLAATMRAELITADDPVKARSHCGIVVEASERGVPVHVIAIGEVLAGQAAAGFRRCTRS
jgi:diphthamide biosynthesis methyltransferase